MYKCFENIPLAARQSAYDAIVAEQRERMRWYGYLAPANFWIYAPIEAGNPDKEEASYCPFGVVNRELSRQLGQPDLNIPIPRDGKHERAILAAAGIDVNAKSATRFIMAIDAGRIHSITELALAMGVTPDVTTTTP